MNDRDFKKLLDTARKALSHMGADDHRPVSLKYEGPRAFVPMRESEVSAPRPETFTEWLKGLIDLARSHGMDDTHMTFTLLFTALALADKNDRGGTTRERFLAIAGITYDRQRASLTTGAQG